jgi:hypothetical protein
MGLTYPFKTSLVLLNGFEIGFVQNLLHIQCKNYSIKNPKIKITKNSEISPDFNYIFSNHQVMLQLPGFEGPYVLCTCFYLTKVFNNDITNLASTFIGARSFGPFHQRLQIYPSSYLITKNVLSPQKSTEGNIKSL